MTLASNCPGARIFRDVRPEYITCPGCGHDVEIWSDELVARCLHCGRTVAKTRGASCIDWCAHAAECIGAQKLQRLRAQDSGARNSAKSKVQGGSA